MIETLDKTYITTQFQVLQDDICRQLEAADGVGVFREDRWDRPGGGGGRARVIEGQHIQKGGVNFSAVHGPLPEKIGKALGLEQSDFFATGVSIVLHPKSPMVPIIHMNVRYFEMSNGGWWFGGGIDLTPHYVVPEDAVFFHRELKKVCDAYHPDFYPKFKTWADDYFYLKHRKETRGIGGIFFDRMNDRSYPLERAKLFDYVLAVGNTFAPTYVELLNRHKDETYGEKELLWQGVRRGRYVEFNLVWDKGTKFGLDTDGRTESILMSMPPVAQWIYDFQVADDSAEAQTLSYLRKGIDWV